MVSALAFKQSLMQTVNAGFEYPPTFLLVLQLLIPLAAAALLAAGGVCTEGTLANE